MEVRTERVFLSGDVRLPGVQIHLDPIPHAASHLILCHGLGAKNPKHKDHTSDAWIPIASGAALPLVRSAVLYTSRGHRGSTGWEPSAEFNLAQFTWENLADDMIAVARQASSDTSQTPVKVIVGGSSMGSAAAFYTALRFPDEVAGVVMLRPPTGWEERLARRHVLMKSAEKCKASNELEDKHHFVLQGTALSDFPALEDLQTYRKIACPVLVLAVEGDETHPISTAQALVERLSQGRLVVSRDLAEAKAVWPGIIAEFIKSLTSTA